MFPKPTNPTFSALATDSLLVLLRHAELREDLARAPEPVHRRRHPGVHHGVKEDLADLALADAVRERRPHVDLHLVRLAHRNQHRQGDDAADLPRHRVGAPDLGEEIPRHEILEPAREVGRLLDVLLAQLGAEQLAPDPDALLEQRVAHGSSPLSGIDSSMAIPTPARGRRSDGVLGTARRSPTAGLRSGPAHPPPPSPPRPAG